ncbi:hypothetical protein KZZ07_06025 [Mameliella sp. CS4]|uniref:hypothetical protein n=1 Tax=Mameliella sp. CS4 TaxID=2862329 RepID=UPI001C5ECAB2|nr:hypothetical protein [Mameliella sp. CS4]MBW4982097.1 hypothetical protein [Mameliella sp. CS4]
MTKKSKDSNGNPLKLRKAFLFYSVCHFGFFLIYVVFPDEFSDSYFFIPGAVLFCFWPFFVLIDTMRGRLR